MAKLPIAVQLYTLRDLTARDMPGTLKETALIGYRAVELAGYGNLKTATDVRKALDDAGLSVCGAHVAIEQLEAEMDKVFDDHRILGNKNIIIPWMPEHRRTDAAGWKKVAGALNVMGAKAREQGFTLAYHNHSFEFQDFGGKTGMDIFWGNSDEALLKSELDTYWIEHGGFNPVTYLNQLGKRVVLVHLKDMSAGPERRFAEVGTGIINIKGIIAAAEQIGVQAGVVEQDSTYGTPPLEAIRTSFENLRRMGAV